MSRGGLRAAAGVALVDDVDDPVDAPGQPDGERDLIAIGGGRAGEDDDAVPHGDRDDSRAGPQHLAEDLADLGGHLIVRPQEHAQQVAAADDAEQATALVHDRKQANLVSVHCPGRAANLGVRVDRDGRCGHQLSRGEPAGLAWPLPMPGDGRPFAGGPLLLGEQVSLGDHARHLPS